MPALHRDHTAWYRPPPEAKRTSLNQLPFRSFLPSLTSFASFAPTALPPLSPPPNSAINAAHPSFPSASGIKTIPTATAGKKALPEPLPWNHTGQLLVEALSAAKIVAAGTFAADKAPWRWRRKAGRKGWWWVDVHKKRPGVIVRGIDPWSV
ncbi:hypothetical protein M427DRAFT_73543 [Gonapodya prolifera JEL478]|uniref:Uncharacterized protein n=1 Tax=Gonapodya prolifera (strain JEL478) TaxID=1344416 RepID=A0A139A1W7_GONPJ|nr:hypothetical protein M427DRAFT_73543 [Gonapodya prolifera JEL478]|eukprot:KXS10762.1 hypothetical protein M427DRAFT_73543 [Gonapodya prolifera JEL478]